MRLVFLIGLFLGLGGNAWSQLAQEVKNGNQKCSAIYRYSYEDQASSPCCRYFLNSPCTPRSQANPKTPEYKSSQESNPPWGRPIEQISAFLVLATGIILYVQLRSLRDQTKAAVEAAAAAQATIHITALGQQISLRAYIFFKDIVFDPKSPAIDEADQRHRWLCAPRLENCGSTPAKDLRIYADWCIRDESIDFAVTDVTTLGKAANSPGGEQSTLGPNGIVGTQPASIPSEYLNLTNPTKPTKFIYAWGWAEYNDVFPDTPRHRTEFCFRITCVGEAKAGDKTVLRFYAVGPHNGHDEECSKKQFQSQTKG